MSDENTSLENGLEQIENVSDDGSLTNEGEQSGQDGSAAASQTAKKAEEWFLDVGDGRTRYRTREEAVNGFKNAGQRISQLSGYEKVLRKYGAQDASPEVVDGVIRELMELRKYREAAELAKANAAATKSDARTVTSDRNLTPEQRQALDWLRENAREAGYVPKEDLEKLAEQTKALREQMEELQGFRNQTNEQYLDSLVRQGQSEIRTLLKGANLLSNDAAQGKQMQLMAERVLRSWIEEDGDRLERFRRGGDSLNELIREGYAEMEPIFNGLRTKQTASYAGKKATQSGVKQVAKPGSGAAKNAPAPKTKSGDVDFTGLNDKAWDMFQRIEKGEQNEE